MNARFCEPHQKLSDQHYERSRPNSRKRGYNRLWEKVRVMVLARDHGLCVICRREGKTTPGKEVDHIIPKRRGGTNALKNLQTLCKPCHSRKTAIEDGRWGD